MVSGNFWQRHLANVGLYKLSTVLSEFINKIYKQSGNVVESSAPTALMGSLYFRTFSITLVLVNKIYLFIHASNMQNFFLLRI